MRFLTVFLALILFSAGTACAQSEADLKQFFEGRRVEVKVEMPASRGGVNVYPERTQTLDFGHYRNLLKKYGIGVDEGERIMITKIQVKDRHIEFQLGGGGYGGLGDEKVPTVYVPQAGKTSREKNLEREIKNETDERRRRRLRERLDDLRWERQTENNRNRAEVADAEELARQRIQEKRLQAGSRFNIRFDRRLTGSDLTPQAVMDALADYVDFER